MPPANTRPQNSTIVRSINPSWRVPHDGTPQPGLSVRRRLGRRAPLPDAASFRRAGSGARCPGPGAIRNDPGRQSPDRDVDVGHGPESPARPRLGRPGQPARRLRRAAGGGGILRRVLRRSRARRLGGTSSRRSRSWRRPSARSRTPWVRFGGSSPTRAGAPSADGAFAGACSTASWTCRRPSRSWRPRRTSVATSSASRRRAASPPPRGSGWTAGWRRGSGRLRRRSTCRASPRDLPMAALVVHDREDTEVRWAEGASIAAAWPGAELLTTRGLGHRRILRDPAVVARVIAFLAARLAPDTSPTRESADGRHALLSAASGGPDPTREGARYAALSRGHLRGSAGRGVPGRPPRPPRCPIRGPSAGEGARPRPGAFA